MVWCRVLGGIHSQRLHAALTANAMWVVVNIRVPFRVLTIIRHLIFRVPKRDPNFDNYPCVPRRTAHFGPGFLRPTGQDLRSKALGRREVWSGITTPVPSALAKALGLGPLLVAYVLQPCRKGSGFPGKCNKKLRTWSSLLCIGF